MNPIPVELYRLPRQVLMVAEGQNLVERGIVMMDKTPLHGGVCIYSFEKFPVLIGQKDWSVIHHVFAEPDWQLLERMPVSFTDYVDDVYRKLNAIPTTKAWWKQAVRAGVILYEYLNNPGCADRTAVAFCLVRIWSDFQKEVSQ